MTQKVQHSRSFAKAISWRTVGSIYTFIIAYMITGKLDISTFIVGIEVVSKTFLYYIHERAWMRVKWGVTPPAVKQKDVPEADAIAAQPELSAA
jgi:uncharacterized membrane protein